MADVSVRPARVDDAAEIGRIQVETWRTAYADILPAPVLAGLAVEPAAEAWAAAISTPPTTRHRVVVALEQDWLVGFAALAPAEQESPADGGPAAEDVTSGEAGAVAPILVEPRWGRRGHGSRLLAAVTDLAREDGVTRLEAWVPEQDQASQAFLTSAGWAPEGMVRALDTGAGELREVRMHTSLA